MDTPTLVSPIATAGKQEIEVKFVIEGLSKYALREGGWRFIDYGSEQGESLTPCSTFEEARDRLQEIRDILTGSPHNWAAYRIVRQVSVRDVLEITAITL